MPPMGEDPFYLVKGEIQDQVNDLQTKYARWSGMSQTNPARAQLCSDMQAGLHSLAWQLTELEKAIGKAEREPSRFNLTTEELRQRRSWVQNTSEEANHLQRQIQVGSSSPDMGISGMSGVTSVENPHSSFVDDQRLQQEMILKAQDQQLDDIGLAVGRIGEVGRAMHDELTLQGRMLDELDTDMDGTSTRIKAAQRKINEVVNRMSMRKQLCIIGVLMVVLIVLAIVAFT